MTSPDPARLHEVRRDWASGRPLGRVFRSTTASIEARTSRDGVRLHRLFGPCCDDLVLPWADVAALACAFERWASVRDAWASYVERGLPPTPIALRLYQPPGKEAEARVLGYDREFAGRRVFHFRGADQVRPLARPRREDAGVTVIADLWRTEPEAGPIDGERVGERWALAQGLALDVRRGTATLHVRGCQYPWIGREWDFPRQLLALRPRGA